MNIDEFKTMILDMLPAGIALTEIYQTCPDLICIGMKNKNGKERWTYISQQEIADNSNPNARLRYSLASIMDSLGGKLKKDKDEE